MRYEDFEQWFCIPLSCNDDSYVLKFHHNRFAMTNEIADKVFVVWKDE